MIEDLDKDILIGPDEQDIVAVVKQSKYKNVFCVTGLISVIMLDLISLGIFPNRNGITSVLIAIFSVISIIGILVNPSYSRTIKDIVIKSKKSFND